MNRAERRARARQPMYQVQVTIKNPKGKDQILLVGPRFDRKDALGPFCQGINLRIRQGLEKVWRDPQIVQVNNIA